MSRELQMSPVQERAERLQRARNLRPPRERRKRAFPVNRPPVRRPSAAQERAEKPERARNLRPGPKREQVSPGNRPPVARPARSSRGQGRRDARRKRPLPRQR